MYHWQVHLWTCHKPSNHDQLKSNRLILRASDMPALLHFKLRFWRAGPFFHQGSERCVLSFLRSSDWSMSISNNMSLSDFTEGLDIRTILLVIYTIFIFFLLFLGYFRYQNLEIFPYKSPNIVEVLRELVSCQTVRRSLVPSHWLDLHIFSVSASSIFATKRAEKNPTIFKIPSSEIWSCCDNRRRAILPWSILGGQFA